MSFPRYQNYKNSGVGWLGDVPEHWKVMTIRRVASSVQTGTTPSTEPASAEVEGGLAWYTPGDFRDALRLSTSLKKLSSNSIRNGEVRKFPPGSVLIVGIGATLGKVGYLERISSANQQINAVVPNASVDGYFLAYSLCVKAEIMRVLSNASTIGIMNQERTKEVPLAVPPLSEQSGITAFLDRETAKIDALVEEQRRLVDLLKEKRRAVISHTVTKGLDPNARMKSSGVAWLGEVPNHWKICPVKRLCDTITDGAHVSPETEGGVFCFVSTQDLIGQAIDFDDCLRTSEASYKYLVRTGCRPHVGDVLFSKDGTIGRTVVVNEERDFVVASSLIIIRPDKKSLDAKYLHLLCQSAVVRNQVESFVKGAGLPRLSIQNLLRVVGLFPPIEEQIAIAAFLDRETGKIDALTIQAEAGIALLQERRSALISAAVTGKIDVRGLAPVKAEAA
jgi:type I restriction enzyme S subunit